MAAKEKNPITSLGTVRAFLTEGTWSQTLMSVVDRSFDHPMKLEESASALFAGGIMQYGFQCGMIWGAALAAGAQAFRLHGPGAKAETAAIMAAQQLVEAFRASNKSETIDCVDITDLDKTSSVKDMVMFFLVKGGTIGCFRMAARYAPVAFEQINTAFSETDFKVPPLPVSCAAVLAQKMGASELQTAMASGFAGGIGLSGGACGALGAAIWLTSIDSITEGDTKLDFNNPRASELVDRFIESSDYEFECSLIVGRKFEDISDHADYISNGGCSEIIEVLTGS